MFGTVDHRESLGGGREALSFAAQQVVGTIGTAVITYPIYLDVEIGIHPSRDSTLLLWRCVAILLPILVGFGIGFGIQTVWASAYRSGRFIWVLPVIWFSLMFARTLSQLPFTASVKTYLADAGGLEMTLGACFYSIGLVVAYQRSHSQIPLQTGMENGEQDATHSRFPRTNPFD